MISNNFIARHNGPRKEEIKGMLKKIGVSSLDELIEQTIPSSIRLKEPLNLPKGINEYEYLNHIKEIASKNKIYKSYIGLGYYNTIVPGVILRNVLENPGWYTSYTPYQAEISQGRLEALLNFQTMVSDLTAMPLANCSLLDEGTAAAEAMIMAFNTRSRAAVKKGVNVFYVSDKLFPQSIDILKTRSNPLGIELKFGDYQDFDLNDNAFGAIIQYPDEKGNISDYKTFVVNAHNAGVVVAVATDIMSLALLTPPGEWGADIVIGSTQRLGSPLGYGGPHAAYLASVEKYKRQMPGRIIGVSIDAKGNRALRLALQTREQHIKRDKATSNICTAQALLAIMAGFYAAYHGQEGIKAIAEDINNLTNILNKELLKLGYKQKNEFFFDTLEIELPENVNISSINKSAIEKEINFRYIDNKNIGISIDETTSLEDINTILNIFAKANNKEFTDIVSDKCCGNCSGNCNKSIPENLKRKSEFLTHPVFNTYHSETEMMRYIKSLEIKDLSLNRAMIPLGSCTMKLNAATELFSLSWPEFGNIHPFVPKNQAEGYQYLIEELGKELCEITGFSDITFQPNSGAAGEYTGLMVIRKYHLNNGNPNRNICLIPSSAHGTNPASSHMAGFKVVVVKCDDNGNVDVEDLKQKALENKENLGALMITYPSTHGIFEEDILEIIDIIHENGGQVYMDGANMNGQVGLTSPGFIGADVCHLNLHKTFAMPHGGGGPGVGPIAVAKHLVDFLPTNPIVEVGGKDGITAVSSAPYGSALLLPVTYGYIKLLGVDGLADATRYAILNANYLKDCLKDYYDILYTGSKGRCGHEMILDCNKFSHNPGIEVGQIAKRLMDFGIHAPTLAFPVHGTLMVEPTESEPLSELNRFVEAMICIRKEIDEIEKGEADIKNNVIVNAPHTLEMVCSDNWEYPYSREKAAFPVKCDKTFKYWPCVTSVDDGYGDRNLCCRL